MGACLEHGTEVVCRMRIKKWDGGRGEKTTIGVSFMSMISFWCITVSKQKGSLFSTEFVIRSEIKDGVVSLCKQ